MAETTGIQWCNHTFNPWRVKDGTRVVASESQWKEPLKWNRKAACQCGGGFRGVHSPYCPQSDRPHVFCASLADVFEDWQGDMVDSSGTALRVSAGGEWIRDGSGGILRNDYPLQMSHVRSSLFALIEVTPNLDWLLLTKRPENIEFMLRTTWVPTKLGIWDRMTRGDFSNLWIGTSVEDQETAEARIPHLLKVPARVRFLSVEPLIGPVNLKSLTGCRKGLHDCNCFPAGIDWVIIGGESGPNARPCSMEWIRSLMAQCKQAGIACFVKQLGTHVIGSHHERLRMIGEEPIGEDTSVRWRLRDPKGGDPDEWPEDIRVRQFPKIDSVSSS